MIDEDRHSAVSPPPESPASADNGSPGSHLRNWQPGDDNAEELMLQKIADALRNGESERHIAKLLNVPRSMLWRGKKLAAIPEGLYERLAEARPRIGIKARIFVGRYCETGELPPLETECCIPPPCLLAWRGCARSLFL